MAKDLLLRKKINLSKKNKRIRECTTTNITQIIPMRRKAIKWRELNLSNILIAKVIILCRNTLSQNYIPNSLNLTIKCLPIFIPSLLHRLPLISLTILNLLWAISVNLIQKKYWNLQKEMLKKAHGLKRTLNPQIDRAFNQ